MHATVLLAQANESALERILADIPHDPAAFFVYLLLAASLLLIWRANRRGSRSPARRAGPETSSDAPGGEETPPHEP